MPWKCPRCSQKCGDGNEKKAPTCHRVGCNRATSKWEEDQTGRIRNGTFKIEDKTLDEDMQMYGLDAVIRPEMAAQMMTQGKIKALQLLNAKIESEQVKLEGGGKLTLTDFENSGPLYWAKDRSTQHAEWKCTKNGFTTGGHRIALEVQAKIDIDDIPAGKQTRGPDRPHVGWTLNYRPSDGNSAKPKGKFNGHVFIDRAYVSRNGELAITEQKESKEEE